MAAVVHAFCVCCHSCNSGPFSTTFPTTLSVSLATPLAHSHNIVYQPIAHPSSATMPTQTLRVQALFTKKGGNTTTKKPSTVKKAAPAPKPKSSGTRKTKGWFGDEGGAQNLDKWYGTYKDLFFRHAADRAA